MELVQPAVCPVVRVLQLWNRPEKVTVVDQGDSTWNLLLAELSTLSKIVEQSANNRNHESSSSAASGQRER